MGPSLQLGAAATLWLVRRLTGSAADARSRLLTRRMRLDTSARKPATTNHRILRVVPGRFPRLSQASRLLALPQREAPVLSPWMGALPAAF